MSNFFVFQGEIGFGERFAARSDDEGLNEAAREAIAERREQVRDTLVVHY